VIDSIDHGGVRELRLARPPANAFNLSLIRALTEAIRNAPGEGAEALTISGAPGLFSGGLDVPELMNLGREEIKAFWRAFYDMLHAAAASEVPIAAAITGHCPAAGAVLAVFCDHRVMADGPFKIGMNEVQVGLTVPPVLQYAMKRLTGPRHGDALLIQGALVSPTQALRVGMVDEVLSPEDVVPSRPGRSIRRGNRRQPGGRYGPLVQRRDSGDHACARKAARQGLGGRSGHLSSCGAQAPAGPGRHMSCGARAYETADSAFLSAFLPRLPPLGSLGAAGMGRQPADRTAA
jgi:3,2-trans-enoyl-CoA isomerase